MGNRKVNIIVNLNITSKKADEKYEVFIEDIIKYHRKIDYHLKQVDKYLGFIDDAVNGLDGDFEDNWL